MKMYIEKIKCFSSSLFLWGIILFINCSVIFIDKRETRSIFDSLNFQEILNVEITANFDSLLNNRRMDTGLPAIFSYTDEWGNNQAWDIELLLREGDSFRRRVCDFPSFGLTFPKIKIQESGFSEHNDLKLVTQCIHNNTGNEYLLKEYLVYKLYQIFTPISYRVQLLRVKYNDPKNNRSFSQYAILLEDEGELAERLNGEICDNCYNLSYEEFRKDIVDINDLFQFLIGNSDWNVQIIRNVLLIKSSTDKKFLIVPYDFDFSGIVNAPYSIPHSDKISLVTQRIFLGEAKSPDEIKETIELFKIKQKEIENYIINFKLVKIRYRDEMLRYVDSFFKCLIEGLNFDEPGRC